MGSAEDRFFKAAKELYPNSKPAPADGSGPVISDLRPVEYSTAGETSEAPQAAQVRTFGPKASAAVDDGFNNGSVYQWSWWLAFLLNFFFIWLPIVFGLSLLTGIYYFADTDPVNRERGRGYLQGTIFVLPFIIILSFIVFFTVGIAGVRHFIER